jgi:hypothetical protein
MKQVAKRNVWSVASNRQPRRAISRTSVLHEKNPDDMPLACYSLRVSGVVTGQDEARRNTVVWCDFSQQRAGGKLRDLNHNLNHNLLHLKTHIATWDSQAQKQKDTNHDDYYYNHCHNKNPTIGTVGSLWRHCTDQDWQHHYFAQDNDNPRSRRSASYKTSPSSSSSSSCSLSSSPTPYRGRCAQECKTDLW